MLHQKDQPTAARVGGINYSDMAFQSSDLTLGHRLLLIAMTCLRFGVLFTCFYRLHQLFGDYSRGEIFIRDSVGQLRQFGVACLLWGVVNFLWDGLWFGILANPTRSFQGHFEAFGIGAILIVIAWFMDMAVDLREENELTI